MLGLVWTGMHRPKADLPLIFINTRIEYKMIFLLLKLNYISLVPSMTDLTLSAVSVSENPTSAGVCVHVCMLI